MEPTPEDLQAAQDALRQQRDTADSYVRTSTRMLTGQLLGLCVAAVLWLLTGNSTLGFATAVLAVLTLVGAGIRWQVGRLRRQMH